MSRAWFRFRFWLEAQLCRFRRYKPRYFIGVDRAVGRDTTCICHKNRKGQIVIDHIFCEQKEDT